jgi:DNA-binding transcriptional MerR regulator
MSETGSSLLKPKDVLAATGITHQMLYRYVTLGLIEPAATTAGGQRLFHPHAIVLIRSIRELNETGYSLRDIKDIFFRDEDRVFRACGVRPTDDVAD